MFIAADKALFFSRDNPDDPRLGDLVQPIKSDQISPGALGQPYWVIGGYQDDDGIALNGGRIGAAAGPQAIRDMLYRMTPPLEAANDKQRVPSLYDVGNLEAIAELKDRHTTAKTWVTRVLTAGGQWLGLGGGHDYAFADGAGFIEACAEKKARPLVINFDAHLDVRPLDHGLSSGTPFYRLLTDYQDFDFVEIGIQSHCTSRVHLEWARSKGAQVLTLDEMRRDGDAVKTTCRFLAPLLSESRATYLSIDIDAFSSAYAMGCSQSFAGGLLPETFFVLLRSLLPKLNLQAIGIYEVSPRFDLDNRTAKLAAEIAHRLLFHANQEVL